ncbi:anacyclamide/piricyclamide family prenylated cyclic peptide [Limnothrix redekei]|uniref:Anacyclamide/piricyclamide family prenylated cyclic peptide n=1 Tax=Limnothrix redekei LRLZ20PSL1 TaxID=3112953 RepID=A0ABW7CFX0_9CYAN
MKKKNLMPQTVAPVQRETSATVSRDGRIAIAPSIWVALGWGRSDQTDPFAGDDAE